MRERLSRVKRDLAKARDGERSKGKQKHLGAEVLEEMEGFIGNETKA